MFDAGAEDLMVFRPYFEPYYGAQEETPQTTERRGGGDEKGFQGGIRIQSGTDIQEQEEVSEGAYFRHTEKE